MNAKRLRAQLDRLVRQVRALGPVLRGSLAQVRLTCGKANCRCRDGERHPAFYLSYRSGGRSKVSHVSAAVVAEARRRHADWLRMKRLLERMADVQVALWKEERREQKKRPQKDSDKTRKQAPGKRARARRARGGDRRRKRG